ncbi:hypothetical protein C8F01DRAFT_1251743 [Mycena amicta]|nr:hypothetical protein C8F01DRAFT_1251743 [Mycena amicta]
MNRHRHNKSKKVPNVRLRPADPEALRPTRRVSPDPEPCYIQDSQIVASDDTVMLPGTCPRPFKNVILCATGILDKATVFKFAVELGASPISAFTDRVTHLIAEKHGGAKYQCALERKIPILKPSWITESHRIWQHGDDVDLEESVAQHRLAIFSDVVLCISGLPVARRAKIAKEVEKHGGKYMAALERPVRVTHLLCAGETETDKMHYAGKFNRAQEANPPIQLVWEEWFWDCLEFGGRFDEARYDVQQPRTERLPTDQPATNPSNAPPSTDIPSAFDDEDPDADELASVQRVPAITLQLWQSLLKTRGYELNQGGNVMLSPNKAREIEEQQKQSIPGVQDERVTSVISSFRRANTVIIPRATSMVGAPSAGPSRLPFARATTVGGAIAGPSTILLEEDNAIRAANDSSSTVFVGVSFALRGETDTITVRDAIASAGGRVMDEAQEVDYIIVRLVGGSTIYLQEKSPELRPRYRTECWLEQCLSMEKICPPDEHITFLPLGIRFPVPGANKIVLSFSGLEASEACWIRRLLKALGITLATAFSRQSTHLLCPSGAGAKYEHALRWRTPVVNIGWLEEMARTGSTPDVLPFLVNIEAEPLQDVKPRNAKGKQKAEDTMQDITNNSQESQSPPAADKAFFLPSLPPPRSSTDSTSNFGRASSILGGDGPPASPSPPKRHQSIPVTRPSTPLPLQPSRSAIVRTPTPTTPSRSAAAPRRSATIPAYALPREGSRGPPPPPVMISSPARVPSSTSPSPLKRGVSITPPKISQHRTRALEENIISLLGKHPRPATPEDADVVLFPNLGRAGKRTRAQRKVQSRQASDVLPVAAPADIPVVFGGGDRSQSPGMTTEEGGYEGLSIGAEEQSFRVVYEDPGQREEKQRLANLVGASLEGDASGSGGGGGGGARKRPRRSTRKPGF